MKGEIPFVNTLTVVESKFIGTKELSWEELFEGFDEIYAITFSSGLQFMNHLLDRFSYAEVVMGCEDVVNEGLEYIIAIESAILEQITKKKHLMSISKMIVDNKLKLYISRDSKSHEKIYLLRNADGKTRVITGSANMSRNAFCGYQRENITYYNDKEAFDWYYNRFVEFRDKCSGEANKKVIEKMSAGEVHYLQEHPEDASVMKEAKTVVVEIEQNEPDMDTVEIVANIKGLESELKPLLPKPKKNKIVIMPKDIITFTKKVKEYHVIKEQKKRAFPKLHIDYDTKKVDFNGEEFNLNPDKESVSNDIGCITTFLNSLEGVYGQTKQAQKDYFSYMNWYFASAFMPFLKWNAYSSGSTQQRFPVYGMLYGPSNGGKSTFIRILSKSVCGKEIPLNASPDFTTTNISKLKCGCEGLPINIEDLDGDQFKNHMRMIKNDEWGIQERFINYPAVSMTTNKVPSIEAPISKRMISFFINVGIDREYGLNCDTKMNQIVRKIGNSLYSEYVKRMFSEIEEMVEKMHTDEEYQPDIFKVSSEVLVQIFHEYGYDFSYIRKLSISDYMGDKVVGRNAIDKIVKAWENEKMQFVVDRKRNKLVYNIPKYGNSYELRYIADGLPVSLNAIRSNSSLSMDLDKAEEFFEIKFKKGLFR